ncbi:hypothetical protein MYSTI_07223 [Myxococcus stipitatus DSM 14675]|uniref:DoxX family protein n=1 Tax=Myxococcus stipitatus (strain DSM 14675 / JCM 12634 / Mx s8) TaxID=1278073 RepID=L7UKS8_MYXSD|nr:hypothetical protein MYSTI_07223 [Myxococcus stipitatus DSM 14675]
MTSAAPVPAPLEPPAPVTSPPAPSTPQVEPWSLARRYGFRFVFAFLFLYHLPFPPKSFWQPLEVWLARHVFGHDLVVPTGPSGSGDKAVDYAHLAFMLTLSFLVAGVWSFIDRRRTDYVKAHDFLRVYVRYILAVSMLSYGFAKVIKTQFPFPNLERLTQPLGDLSPMGLLWTFMGYSPGYNLFTGGAEALGGLLLFFRRTTTLGALVVIGVMVNVVALNFFYDVPVKLYSSLLVSLAVFLLLPDLRRLADVLVFNRATQPTVLATPFTFSSRVTWALRGVKAVFIGWMLYSSVSQNLSMSEKWGDAAPHPPLYGFYDVESFTRDGQVLPPLLGDTHRWRAFIVNRHGPTVRKMDDSRKRYFGTYEEGSKSFTLAEGRQPDAAKLVLAVEQPDAEHLVLKGPYEGATIEVKLRKVDTASKFLLVGRGFNWVQEFPFNR